MSGCTPEMAQELERWLEGDLAAPEREAMAAHLGGCTDCRAHRDWLRAERDLFAARARAHRAALPNFDGVLARMQGAPVLPLAPTGVPRERARGSLIDGRAFALSLCAAAALLCVALPQRDPDGPLARPEPRGIAAATAAGAAVAGEDASEEACGVRSCCSTDESPCATSDDSADEVAGSDVSPEASLCGDGPCMSVGQGDRSSSMHAVRVVDRTDLTCSEDL